MEGAVTTFESLGVCDKLAKSCDNLGWKTPTKIQIKALPHAFQGKDLFALAQTGSSDIAAFCLPILQAILEFSHSFFACVITPTGALASQIAEQFEALASPFGVKCALLVGGKDMRKQAISLRKLPNIIVATPKRLLEHLEESIYLSLSALKYLVLYEADKLLNGGGQKVLDDILRRIPRERITYLFSETMSSKVKMLERACLKRDHEKIQPPANYQVVDTITGYYVLLPAEHKGMQDCYLLDVLSRYREGVTAMVFTRTCEATSLLAMMLCNLSFRAIPFVGNMAQLMRAEALQKFRSGECNILVCSDATLISYDRIDADVVINYDVPESTKKFIQRVGRKSTCSGQPVIAISLVNQHELELYLMIEQYMGRMFPESGVLDMYVMSFRDKVSEAKKKCQSEGYVPDYAEKTAQCDLEQTAKDAENMSTLVRKKGILDAIETAEKRRKLVTNLLKEENANKT